METARSNISRRSVGSTSVSPLTYLTLTSPAAAPRAAGGTAHARHHAPAPSERALGERLGPRYVPGSRDPKTLAGRRAGHHHDRRLPDGDRRERPRLWQAVTPGEGGDRLRRGPRPALLRLAL